MRHHGILIIIISFILLGKLSFKKDRIVGKENSPDVEAVKTRGMPWNCHRIDQSSRGADGVKLADVNGDKLSGIAAGSKIR